MGSARGHGCALRRPDKAPLIDQSYAPDQVGDVGAALVTAGAWPRDTQKMTRWRRFISLTTLLLAAVINNTFFGDGQAKGGLGEMPSASRRDTVPCMHSGESGKCGNPSCDAPSGCPSADLAVLSTVMSRSKR